MKAIEVICYKTSDGKLFEDDVKANKHQLDIVGEALDDLLANDDRGNVTRSDRFSMLLNTLKDANLKKKVTALYEAVIFSNLEQ